MCSYAFGCECIEYLLFLRMLIAYCYVTTMIMTSPQWSWHHHNGYDVTTTMIMIPPQWSWRHHNDDQWRHHNDQWRHHNDQWRHHNDHDVTTMIMTSPQCSWHTQVEPAITFTDEERDALTLRIQNGGTEVVEAKAGAVSSVCVCVCVCE